MVRKPVPFDVYHLPRDGIGEYARAEGAQIHDQSRYAHDEHHVESSQRIERKQTVGEW